MLECLKLSGGRSGKTGKKATIRVTDPFLSVGGVEDAKKAVSVEPALPSPYGQIADVCLAAVSHTRNKNHAAGRASPASILPDSMAVSRARWSDSVTSA